MTYDLIHLGRTTVRKDSVVGWSESADYGMNAGHTVVHTTGGVMSIADPEGEHYQTLVDAFTPDQPVRWKPPAIMSNITPEERAEFEKLFRNEPPQPFKNMSNGEFVAPPQPSAVDHLHEIANDLARFDKALLEAYHQRELKASQVTTWVCMDDKSRARDRHHMLDAIVRRAAADKLVAVELERAERLQVELGDLRNQLDAQALENGGLQNELVALRRDLGELTDQRDEARRWAKDMEGSRDLLRGDRDNLLNERRDMIAQRDEAQRERDEAQRKLKLAHTECSDAFRQRDAANKKAAAANTALGEVRTQLKRLHHTLND